MCSSQMRPNLLPSPFTPTASSFSSILPSPFTPTASSFSSILLSPFILRPSSFSFVSSTLTTTQQRAITHSRCASSRMTDFDAERFEAERLRLDEQAREAMSLLANHADARGDVEQAGAWKWSIRKRVWDALENQNIARNPRPVHHRIPNFVAAGSAADKLASLQAFQNAKCVKVNPDTPQKQVRFLTLQAGKILLTPQPRLRTGFFSELEATKLPARTLEEACTAAGVAKYGKPLGLDAKIKVDLIVIGSVAVDPNTGARLGKGEGFAELEYGILRYMKAIDDSTLIVTSVHDKQLVDDIPVEKLLIHDVPVDVICTPTQIIFTNTTISKPQGIYWEKLSPEKLNQIRVLRELKEQIEKETGEQLQIGPSEKLPPTPQYRRARTSSTHHTGPSK